MNAEQLNGMLARLSDAHGALNTVKKLGALRSALETLANEPQNGDHQNRMKEALTQFVQAVADERINVFTLREEALIDDLGLRELVGADLDKRVKDAIAGQEVLTPRVASDNVVKIHDALQNRLNRIRDISKGLSELNVEFGDPDTGEVELGMFVPRAEGDLPLEKVLEEGKELNELVSVGYEVIEGKPNSPPVRYLTSSDYGFLLDVAPAVVAFLVLSLERTLALYKNWLDIRLKHHELKVLGASDEHLTPLEAAAEKKRDLDIHSAILGAIKERSKLPEIRQNELANLVVAKVTIFLKKSAEGTYLDVRVGDNEDVPEAAEGESEDAAENRANAQHRVDLLNEVRDMSKRLHALEKKADPAQIAPPQPTRPNTKQR